jgi:DNA-binding CsgD family transcriptional regulator
MGLKFLDDTQITKLMKLMDSNGDGTVELDEFIDFIFRTEFDVKDEVEPQDIYDKIKKQGDYIRRLKSEGKSNKQVMSIEGMSIDGKSNKQVMSIEGMRIDGKSNKQVMSIEGMRIDGKSNKQVMSIEGMSIDGSRTSR